MADDTDSDAPGPVRDSTSDIKDKTEGLAGAEDDDDELIRQELENMASEEGADGEADMPEGLVQELDTESVNDDADEMDREQTDASQDPARTGVRSSMAQRLEQADDEYRPFSQLETESWKDFVDTVAVRSAEMASRSDDLDTGMSSLMEAADRHVAESRASLPRSLFNGIVADVPDGARTPPPKLIQMDDDESGGEDNGDDASLQHEPQQKLAASSDDMSAMDLSFSINSMDILNAVEAADAAAESESVSAASGQRAGQGSLRKRLGRRESSDAAQPGARQHPPPIQRQSSLRVSSTSHAPGATHLDKDGPGQLGYPMARGHPAVRRQMSTPDDLNITARSILSSSGAQGNAVATHSRRLSSGVAESGARQGGPRVSASQPILARQGSLTQSGHNPLLQRGASSALFESSEAVDEGDELDASVHDLDTELQEKLEELDMMTQSEQELLDNLRREVALKKLPGTTSTSDITTVEAKREKTKKKRPLVNQKQQPETPDIDGLLTLTVYSTNDGSLRPHTTGSIDNLAAASAMASQGPEVFDGPDIADVPFDMGEFSLFASGADAADAALLKALVLKYEAEVDWLRSKLQQERHLHKEIGFKIESLGASKNSKIRSIREGKSKIPVLHERIRALTLWLSHDVKSMFEREREKSLLLVQRANDFMKRSADANRGNYAALEKVRGKRQIAENKYMEVRSQAADVRIQCYETEEEIKDRKAQIENVEWEVAEKRKAKNEYIAAKIKSEALLREREIALLSDALEKRRSMGGRAVVYEDLDVVDLSGTGITKVPKALSDIKRARHVDLDGNKLTSAMGVEGMPELISLTANKNNIRKLNLVEMLRLRTLSVAYNNISELAGFTDSLTYLDLTGNPVASISALSSATSLQILVLRNSRITDLESLHMLRKLVYLDMGGCRLSEAAAEHVVDCSVLLYLSMSNNIIYTMPEMPNRMLYEVDLSSNLLTRLNIANWMFMLRVLNLKDNQITDIHPLSMCPFLRVLNLENNKVHDVEQLFSISVCQQLQILDLSSNPIETSPLLYKIVGTMFPSIQTLNKQAVCRKSGDPEKRVFIYGDPLKSARVCRDCVEHLTLFVRDQPDVQEAVNVYQEWRSYANGKEQALASFMGAYRTPFLEFLISTSTQYSKDPLVRIQIQERRLLWLTNLLTQMTNDHDSIPLPSMETAILPWVETLNGMIDEYRVIYVQSLWRMMLRRKSHRMLVKKIRIGQRAIRHYLECRPAKQLLKEMVKARDDKAATVIQRHYRGFSARRQVEAMRKELGFAVELGKPHELILGEEEQEEDPAKWIGATNVNQFDDHMNEYLATEELIHYPGDGKDTGEDDADGQDGNLLFPFDPNRDVSVRQTPVPKNRRGAKLTPSRLGMQRDQLIKQISLQYTALANSVHTAPTQNAIAQTILINSGIVHNKELGVAQIPMPLDTTRIDPLRSETSMTHRTDMGMADATARGRSAPGAPTLGVAGGLGATPLRSLSRPGGDGVAGADASRPQTQPIPGDAHDAYPMGRLLEDRVRQAFEEHQQQLQQNRQSERSPSPQMHDRLRRQDTQPDALELAEELGWTGYSATTQALLEKKRRRMQKLEGQPLERETLKDPLKRYEMFRSHLAGDDGRSVKETLPQRSARAKLKLKQAPVIYEWDIHPGETSQKMLGRLKQEHTHSSMPVPPIPELGVVGPGAEYLAKAQQIRETRPIHTPQVTLLINNYVANKALESPPTTLPIHRWLKNDNDSFISIRNVDTQSVTVDGYRSAFKPRYTTDMGKVVASVPVPPPRYGTYQLYRHPPLPAIAFPSDSSSSSSDHQ
ncbi:hypothetical protein BC831DRAFT_441378 [Entophlyctis helioformis]|nr:hypothetical protein BC831DRAFT_441378 [Entophlyctis helioformis]